MAITKEDVIYVAKLSKIEVNDEQINSLTKDMQNMVSFVEKINEVNTDSVEPLSSIVNQKNIFRDDISKPSLDITKSKENAPEFENNSFVVPQVIE